MYEMELKDLEKVSKEIGKHNDYVQGGGGNTSIKLDREWMAIKASGYKLDQVRINDGFAVINYKKVTDYMNDVDFKSNIDYEKESVEFIRKNVLELKDIKLLRPSIEAGFHSLLKKAVIHTHPVYSNIICCCKEGKDLLKKIFNEANIGFIWVPYIKPGFSLSYYIMNKGRQYKKENGKFIDVIFMENHGLIVNDDNTPDCIKLHEEVNGKIRKYFNLSKYPRINIKKIEENIYKSNSEFILDFIKNNKVDVDFFNENALYPDQIVYLNEYLSKKIFIENNEVIYKTNQNEALSFEETLAAYFYVIDQIRRLKFSIKNMPSEETDYIKNWEVEKFRRKILNNG